MSATQTAEGPLQIGLIGCGTISVTHADAIAGLQNATLVACCDIIPERATDFGAKYGIDPSHIHTTVEAFLNDPAVQAVSVCTPSGLHADVAIAALDAGKPVIIEKPMDVTVAACDRLVDAQKRTGLQLGVISQHRFDEASVVARKLIDEGAIGKLFLVEAQIKWHRTQEYYDSGDWRGTWALDGGGALMNQGVHTVDLMRWLAGPVNTVYAVARTAAHERVETEDVVCATLTFESGAIGNLVASTAAYPGFPATLSLHGTLGSIVISGDVLQTVATKEPTGYEGGGKAATHALQVARGGTKTAEEHKVEETVAVTGASDPTTIWGDAHRSQIGEFADAVLDGRAPAIDGVAGRQAVQVVRAVYESAQSGKLVTL
ncbi:MAG TPA: Gfo/Idh/MocA family oxidoreductase [Capsulimonadaceae bacterium]|jgi:predicted dehydrogenase